MNKVPKIPRLYRRGNIYYHRAAIPTDIQDTYPRSAEISRLKTSDYKEARVRVRAEAARVDRLFEKHRRDQQRQEEWETRTPAQSLTDQQLQHIYDCYLEHLMTEDDQLRYGVDGNDDEDGGFYEVEGDLPKTPRPSFEEYKEETEANLEIIKGYQARAKVDPFLVDEVDEVYPGNL